MSKKLGGFALRVSRSRVSGVALKSFRVVSAFASFGATGVYFAVSVFTAFPPSLRFGAASRRDGEIPFRRAEGGGQNRLLRLKPPLFPEIRQ
jgi:hypothetical protein